jgi:hypothetical protein
MPLAQEVINVCRQHLTATNAFATEIEAFLVQYLLVVICGEYEQTIEALIEQRAEKAGDDHLTAFVKAATGARFRNPRTSDISGLLGWFDSDLKNTFSQRIKDTPAQRAFDTIVTNRHAVAHQGGNLQLTFNELCERFEESKSVLTEVQAILGLA